MDKILVPLDCSPRAECVLPLATALARTYESELILAHIVPEPEMPRRVPPSPEDVALAAQLTERNRREAEHYLSELQHRLTYQIRVENPHLVNGGVESVELDGKIFFRLRCA